MGESSPTFSTVAPTAAARGSGGATNSVVTMLSEEEAALGDWDNATLKFMLKRKWCAVSFGEAEIRCSESPVLLADSPPGSGCCGAMNEQSFTTERHSKCVRHKTGRSSSTLFMNR